MRVPFALERVVGEVEAADALLLPSDDARALLELAARIAESLRRADGERSTSESWPRVHRTADGLLLIFATPLRASFPGTIRLRAIAPGLLVPADAALVPALLDDEARAIVRDRGLVFLPFGRALAFDPAKPLSPADFLAPGPIARPTWQPFEAPDPLAPAIEKVLLEIPHESANDVIERGGDDIAKEPPAPPESPGTASEGAGRVQLGAGRVLSALGKFFGSEGLAGAGANLVRKAVEKAPSLAENVLGKQEAALRELLRKFRAGEIDEALKRALPIGGPGEKGGRPAKGASLPTHDTRYSLGNVLAKGGGGGASVWFGGYDLQRELANEYRKAALEAIRKGDHRRAAFIYAKLLRDYRNAAHALLQGGLAHDAAVLYLETGDQRLAAEAFAAAGELDRAIELYKKLGDHLAAADLYRRLGDEERAVAEIRIHADSLVKKGQYVSAAELLLERAKRSDLAIAVLEQGWQTRPAPGAVACALKLPALYAREEVPGSQRAAASAVTKILALARDAAEVFARPGHEAPAADFWNGLSILARMSELEPVRDDIADLARMGLARKLAERAVGAERAGDAAAAVFQPRAWSPSVVTDAGFALRAGIKGRSKHTVSALPAARRIPIGAGLVTAVVAARRTGEVFIGFERGEVLAFRPIEHEVVRICTPGGAVSGLACSADGNQIAIVRATSETELGPVIESCIREPFARWRLAEKRAMPVAPDDCDPELAPELDRTELGESVLLWSDGESFEVCHGPQLIPQRSVELEEPTRTLTAFHLVPGAPRALLIDAGGASAISLVPPPGVIEPRFRARLGWRPATPASLSSPPISWLPGRDAFEIAAVTESGAIAWAHLRLAGGVALTESRSASSREGFLAVALHAPGRLAAVTATGIQWLRVSGDELALWGTSDVPCQRAIAAFPSERTNEVTIVTADGFVARVPVPA